jgi:hypothetical protein
MYYDAEDEARKALLAHYSAKTTSQTAVLIGYAVAFFAVFQAYDVLSKLSLQFGYYFLVSSVITLLFLVTYAVGRLVYYGELSSAVIFVKMAEYGKARGEVKKRFSEYEIEMPKPESIYPITYLERISCAIGDYVGCRSKHPNIPLWIWNRTSSKWFWRIYGIVVFLAVLSLALLLTGHLK